MKETLTSASKEFSLIMKFVLYLQFLPKLNTWDNVLRTFANYVNKYKNHNRTFANYVNKYKTIIIPPLQPNGYEKKNQKEYL